jgi:hypothetical protein
MLTVLGPQAHILVGGNIWDNTAELLKVCGDIGDSIAELVQMYRVLFSYYCPCIQLCVEDYCHPGVYRINWYISPPYVARARQMPSLRRGLIAKGGL